MSAPLPSLAAARAAWLADARRRNLSARTIGDYDAVTARFLHHVDLDGQVGLEALTLDRARAWLDTLAHLRPASRHTYVRTIKVWSRWCTDEYELPADPLRRLRAPRVPHTRPGLFTPAQLRALLEAAAPATAYAMTLLFETGLRVSEAAALELGDLEDGALHVRHAKGDKERWVPCSPLLLTATEIYLAEIRPLVARADERHLLVSPGRRPWTAHSLHHAMARAGKRAGIAGVRCSPHTARYQFAHDVAMAGGQVFALRELLGHTTLELVGRYAGPTESDLRREIAAHAPLAAALAEARAAEERVPRRRIVERGGGIHAAGNVAPRGMPSV